MIPSMIAMYAIVATAAIGGVALATTYMTDYFNPVTQVEKTPQRIIDTGERVAGAVENAAGSGAHMATNAAEKVSESVQNATGGVSNVTEIPGKLVANGEKLKNDTGSSILEGIKKVGEPIANVVGKLNALAPTLPALPTMPSLPKALPTLPALKNVFGLG